MLLCFESVLHTLATPRPELNLGGPLLSAGAPVVYVSEELMNVAEN